MSSTLTPDIFFCPLTTSAGIAEISFFGIPSRVIANRRGGHGSSRRVGPAVVQLILGGRHFRQGMEIAQQATRPDHWSVPFSQAAVALHQPSAGVAHAGPVHDMGVFRVGRNRASQPEESGRVGRVTDQWRRGLHSHTVRRFRRGARVESADREN